MNVRKRKPRIVKERQVIAISIPKVDEVPLEVCLEEAVMRHFLEQKVRCTARVGVSPRTQGKLIIELSRFDGNHLPPSVMRTVRAFIAGYMECERSYAGP